MFAVCGERAENGFSDCAECRRCIQNGENRAESKRNSQKQESKQTEISSFLQKGDGVFIGMLYFVSIWVRIIS